MALSSIEGEDEEGGEISESSPCLTETSAAQDHVTVVSELVEPVAVRNGKPRKNGEAKQPRRLSFHDSVVEHTSATSLGRLRSNSMSKFGSRLMDTAAPFSAPHGPPNHPDLIRGESFKYTSQRASFDLPVLCQIIWVLCCIGWMTGAFEIGIQAIVYVHNSLHSRWSIGFWSGAVFVSHSTVGYLTRWKKLGVILRTLLTKFYLLLSGVLAASCVAEMVCSVYTYNHASELINLTMVYDERSYRISAMEVSIFNSLLAGCGLLGILMAIFATVVTLQRLNIELKIAHSFGNLVSRRSSAIPNTSVEKSVRPVLRSINSVDGKK